MENNQDFFKKISEGILGLQSILEEKKKSLIANSPENEKPIIEKLFGDMGVEKSVKDMNNAIAELNKTLKS